MDPRTELDVEHRPDHGGMRSGCALRLWPLKKKLPRLLKRYPVTLVHPTAEDRCIVKLATDPDVPAQVAEPRLALRGASIGKRLPASRTDHQVAAVYFDSSPATVLRSRTRAPFSTSGRV